MESGSCIKMQKQVSTEVQTKQPLQSKDMQKKNLNKHKSRDTRGLAEHRRSLGNNSELATQKMHKRQREGKTINTPGTDRGMRNRMGTRRR